MAWNERKEYYIGIDSGVNTGIAVYDATKKQLVEVKTVKIHKALEIVANYHENHKIKVVVEDARQVRFKTDPIKAQGAGSVKRDAKIWFDFLIDKDIPHQMVRPNKATTKLNKEAFYNITKYSGQTSQHGRDAALMVFGL